MRGHLTPRLRLRSPRGPVRSWVACLAARYRRPRFILSLAWVASCRYQFARASNGDCRTSPGIALRLRRRPVVSRNTCVRYKSLETNFEGLIEPLRALLSLAIDNKSEFIKCYDTSKYKGSQGVPGAIY